MLRRIGLACLVLLVLPSSVALAAPEDDRAGAEALVQAFPLDPTGERVDTGDRSEPRGRSEAVRALPESAEAVPDSSGTPLGLATGVAVGLLLVLGGRLILRRRKEPSRRRGSTPLSQTGWRSTRRRILDYSEPGSDAERTAIALQSHYPDIPARGRVRTLELPAGETSPPPPPAEWRSVA